MKTKLIQSIKISSLAPLFISAAISMIIYFTSKLIPDDITTPVLVLTMVLFSVVMVYTIFIHLIKAIKNVKQEYKEARGTIADDID